MALEVRTFYKPVEKLCYVKYYVFVWPIGGGSNESYRAPYIKDERYFETREEAENFKTELYKTEPWPRCETYEVREKIEEINPEDYDRIM